MIANPAFEAVWAFWAIVWLLAASHTARTVTRLSYANRLGHVLPLVVGGWLYLAPLPQAMWLGRVIVPRSPVTTWIMLALTIVGIAFAMWARAVLGRLWSGQITLKEDHVLVDRGPYALSRNPIYTGLLFALLATAVARDTVGATIGFALITLGFIVKIRQEEALLAGHFGPVFDDYRRRVRRLVPFVW